MIIEYPVKNEHSTIHQIRDDLYLELNVDYEPIFKLLLIKRNGRRPPYSYDTLGQSVTRYSMDLYVDGGSDGIVREMAAHLFEKANDQGFEVELTDVLMAHILNYKKELLRE